MSDDTISRQAAIDALDKIFPADPMRNDYTQGITCGAALATEYIKELPSAQPEKHTEERTETHACDLIDRQAAIDATRNAKISFTIKSDIDFANYRKEMQEIFNNILDAQEMALNDLPSAQAEPSQVARDIATIIENEKDMRVIAAQPDLDEVYAHAETEAEARYHAEIVRCKDCEYGEQDEVGRWFCRSLGCQIGNEDGSGYCADAERRTDGN